jgi:predicted AAA+ superfamily ATPase
MDLGRLMELDRRAKALGGAREHRRDLYGIVEREEGKHFMGIVGPRGAGKTILLQQLAHAKEDGFYLSADSLERGTDLFDLVRELTERYRYTTFLVDEIHYLEK